MPALVDRRYADEEHTPDDLDLRILAALRHNARESSRSMARRLGVSTGTVTKRIATMEDRGVILRYTALVRSPVAVDGFTMMVYIRTSPTRDAEVGRAVAQIPEVVCVNALAGDDNLQAQVRARTREDFRGVIERIRGIDGVTGLSAVLVLSTIKAVCGGVAAGLWEICPGKLPTDVTRLDSRPAFVSRT